MCFALSYIVKLLLNHTVFNSHEQGNAFHVKFAKIICPGSKVTRYSIYNVVDVEKQTGKTSKHSQSVLSYFRELKVTIF